MKEKEQLLIKVMVERSLDKILAKVSKCHSDEELLALSKNLKTSEIHVLAEGFNDIPKDQELLQKVIFILMQSPSDRVYSIFWRHFNNTPDNTNLYPLLNQLFRSDSQFKETFPIFAQKLYQAVFANAERSFEELAKKLVSTHEPIREAMKNGNLIWEATVRRQLIDRIWVNAEIETFVREDTKFIIDELQLMSPYILSCVIDRYLTIFQIEQFSDLILSWIIDLWGKPADKKKNWSNIALENIAKVEKWLKLKDLKEFFGENNERFHFWKKYIYESTHTEVFRQITTKIIYFEHIVVVVFGITGNAAYFYDRDEFERLYGRRIAARAITNENQLKSSDYMIERLIHRGNWQVRGIQIMNRLMNRS